MMKTTGLLVALMVYSLTLVAQPGPPAEKGKCCSQKQLKQGKGIPGLTEEQAKKIEALRVSFQKEMLPLRNQLGELKAKQRTLTTADKADMKAINANIDEITKLQNQMMKKAAEHRQQIRGILTDEQRLWFDTQKQGRGKFKGGMQMRGNGCDEQNCKMKGEVKGGCPNAK